MKDEIAVTDGPEGNASRALGEIRRLIETGQIDGDGRLPTERELSASLGVGRRAVRRALEALEAEGLIWRRQGKGTFAGQPPDPTGTLAAEIAMDADPLSVMEARLCIEPSLAELCARRATADDVAKMRHLAVRTAQADDSDSAELWDGALHRLIARTAGNRLLLTAFSMLDEVRMGEEWQRQRHRARTPETIAFYDRQHVAIIDAIEARDGQRARDAMAEHLRILSERLRQSLEGGQP
ncbi:FadR/GntR family transcriptional regulator [Halovulum dunhuangense]|uniref:FadR/GntR family transcriptional regulator n=1 Tax=Halovulum dunhuangense TaxID=1505036 RepID=UPI001C0EA140